MLNIAPSRSLGRRTRQLLLFAFLSGSAGVFLIAVGVMMYLIPFAAVGTTIAQGQRILSFVLIGTGIIGVLAALFFLLRSVVRRRENDYAAQTGDYLSQFLDERYKFIRNINQPDLGYIDAVLIGPPGILVFRILNMTGDFINNKDTWARKNRNGEYMPMTTNPTKEAVVDVRAMLNYIDRKNLPAVEVFGVVVFIQDEPRAVFQVTSPVVPVTHLSDLLETLKREYLVQERIDMRLVERITKLLLGDV